MLILPYEARLQSLAQLVCRSALKSMERNEETEIRYILSIGVGFFLCNILTFLAVYCFFGFGAAMGCGIGMDSAPPPADAAAAAGDEDGGYYSD